MSRIYWTFKSLYGDFLKRVTKIANDIYDQGDMSSKDRAFNHQATTS